MVDLLQTMVKIKICGITNLEDALSAGKLGCDALGFVFFKQSPRYITPEHAGDIIKYLPKHIIKIGVFRNAAEKKIRQIAKFCKLDILQFHGQESPQFCQRFKGYKIIKVFRIKDKIDTRFVLKYKSFAYLFDTFTSSAAGGTGKSFDWKLIGNLRGVKQPIFLAGGLNPKNINRAIKTACPDWVDVSSGVESAPGKKDYAKLKKFIAQARQSKT